MAFKQHLRDFLVTVKEFEGDDDNSELFIEEKEANEEMARQMQWEYKASVPGLLSPDEVCMCVCICNNRKWIFATVCTVCGYLLCLERL
jgi:hypothetical protein